jgi:hypothetical protein
MDFHLCTGVFHKQVTVASPEYFGRRASSAEIEADFIPQEDNTYAGHLQLQTCAFHVLLLPTIGCFQGLQ